MTPEITAVVPTHNRSQLLMTTLRTVLWQRGVSLEVIVVDDGSSEDVKALLSRFADPRLRVVRHETPQGVSNARNRGASEARAEWLAFCDDDDLWAPDKLAQQLAAARGSGRTWAYGGAVHVNAALDLLAAKLPPSPEHLVATLPRGNLMPGGSSNVIVRADTFREVGEWDPALINLADWDLWIRIARQGPPARVDRLLVGYRIHVGNASGDTELILREARLMDGRYGEKIDYGELHHYLAWVHLRAGRRRLALAHLTRALGRGNLRGVARTLGTVARRRAADRLKVFAARPARDRSAWQAEVDAWIGPLRAAAEAA